MDENKYPSSMVGAIRTKRPGTYYLRGKQTNHLIQPTWITLIKKQKYSEILGITA